MDPTIFAYIAGFLDGDGSIFFQIVNRKGQKKRFQIRCSIAFYQKTEYVEILEWLKNYFGAGYIRHRKTGISDYTIVEPKEVERILLLLKPYIRLKKKQAELGLDILQKLKTIDKENQKEFLEICNLVDKFGEINYSKNRKINSSFVKNCFKNISLPP